MPAKHFSDYKHPIIPGFNKNKRNLTVNGDVLYTRKKSFDAYSYPYYDRKLKAIVWNHYNLLQSNMEQYQICLLDILKDGLYSLFNEICTFFKIPSNEIEKIYALCDIKMAI